MKNKKKRYLILLILFLGIGFAYLSSNLNIGALVGFRGGKFDVHFENVTLLTDGSSLPTIRNKTTVTFVETLNKVGDEFSFSVDVVNSGDLDAMIDSIAKSSLTETQQKYITYTVTYSDGSEVNEKDRLISDSKTKLIFTVVYGNENIDNAALEAAGEPVNFSYTLDYVLANSSATKYSPSILVGDNFSFVASEAGTLGAFTIYGNIFQQTYEGKNLYNVFDEGTRREGTVDEDGWITQTIDNTAGTSDDFRYWYTNELNIDKSKKYTVVTEVKEVSTNGDCRIYPASLYSGKGQLQNHNYKLSELKAGNVKFKVATPNDVEPVDSHGLRTFFSCPAGASGSITYRLSVIEGEDTDKSNFSYEPYVGEKPSPSPDYPQDLVPLSGVIKFTINGTEYNVDLKSELKAIGDRKDRIYYKNNSWRSVYSFLHEDIGSLAAYKDSTTTMDRYYVNPMMWGEGEAMCTHYIYTPDIASAGIGYFGNSLTTHSSSLHFNYGPYDASRTGADFREIGRTEDVRFIYALEDPMGFPVDDQQLIDALEAVRNAPIRKGKNVIKIEANVPVTVELSYQLK